MKYVWYAIAAAVFYALNAPFAKVLLTDIDSSILAGLLYVGTGVGMALMSGVRAMAGKHDGESFKRSDAPLLIGMVVLDIAAPLLLIAGLSQTSAGTVSLLNNFEIVVTALFARLLFQERIPRRLWGGIVVITVACIVLSLSDIGNLTLSPGALLVLAACACWGLENNCTSRLSTRNTLHVVTIKGLGSGTGALMVGFMLGGALPSLPLIIGACVLGFLSYGMSLVFYISAQRGLGAARTSAYYALAPFIGVVIAWVVFGEAPSTLFLAALALMAVGTWLSLPKRAEKHLKPQKA